MPFAHRLKDSSCSPVKRVLCDANVSDTFAIDNDFSARLCVICGLPVTKAMMPRAKRALNDQRTNGSFLGTNALLSTMHRSFSTWGEQSQNRLVRGLMIARLVAGTITKPGQAEPVRALSGKRRCTLSDNLSCRPTMAQFEEFCDSFPRPRTSDEQHLVSDER